MFKIKIKDANRHLFLTTGYGQMSQYIARGLSTLGHDVYYDYITGSTDDDLDNLAKKPFKHTKDTIYLWIRPPHYVKSPDFKEENKNVFYTMHESETFEGWKSDWPELLNKCKAVIVPTLWNKNIFEKSGVKVPIYVVPLGVDPKIFYGCKSKEFSILSVHEGLGKKGSRENWQMSVEAYLDTFKDYSHEVSFTIKTWNSDLISFHKYVSQIVKQIGKTLDCLSQFNIIDTEFLPQDMNALYGRHHLFLKNANREGWCLPVHEAMTTNMKIVCSDLPPMREFLYENNTSWFKPNDINQLKEVLSWEFKQWRKWKGHVNSFSQKQSVFKLAKVLSKV